MKTPSASRKPIILMTPSTYLPTTGHTIGRRLFSSLWCLSERVLDKALNVLGLTGSTNLGEQLSDQFRAGFVDLKHGGVANGLV